MDNYPDTFAFVQIHAGSDGYDTAWGNARKTFYAVTGYPTTVFDGTLKHSGGHTYSAYQGEFLSRPDTTDVTIELTGDLVSGQTYSVQANVCVESGGAERTMRIHMVQVLDYWPLPSDSPPGASYSRNGFKQAADTHGSEPDITLAGGECDTIVREFTFDARSWSSQEDIKIVAWAQVPGSSWPKEAYQAATMAWPFPSAAALFIELVDEVPEYIPADESTNITVRIEDGSETYDSGLLHYRYDGGTFLTSSLTPLGGDLYEGTLPAPDCGDTPEFYFSAEGDLGTTVYSPEDAPASYYSTSVGTVTVVLDDDFGTDLGWTVENDPSLTDGAWERAIPGIDVDRGAPPEDYDDDELGYCYVTDNDDNDDVDYGPTRLISPTVDLGGASSPILRFAYWWSNDDQDGDPFDVDISNDDGATWMPALTFSDIGYPVESWSVQDIDIAAAIAPEPLTFEMKFRFSVADPVGSASVDEGGLDAVRRRGSL